MALHAYKVGQSIRVTGSSRQPGAAGLYNILALLPETYGDYQYRVQSTDGPQQRVIRESEIAEVFSELWKN
ncbi:hypothetical protein [Afifella sp. IM 167]|uniref:hypothetical protein n=1 Tax=Afifella sp. IM 167 TaxID=2033586 RepID=UPI001CCE965B|nr:hypothetical protein [Afifella sp. IM 167]MBZ8133836.1 hypothetical protein [Afifella sp. IM 167]